MVLTIGKTLEVVTEVTEKCRPKVNQLGTRARSWRTHHALNSVNVEVSEIRSVSVATAVEVVSTLVPVTTVAVVVRVIEEVAVAAVWRIRVRTAPLIVVVALGGG